MHIPSTPLAPRIVACGLPWPEVVHGFGWQVALERCFFHLRAGGSSNPDLKAFPGRGAAIEALSAANLHVLLRVFNTAPASVSVPKAPHTYGFRIADTVADASAGIFVQIVCRWIQFCPYILYYFIFYIYL